MVEICTLKGFPSKFSRHFAVFPLISGERRVMRNWLKRSARYAVRFQKHHRRYLEFGVRQRVRKGSLLAEALPHAMPNHDSISLGF